MGAEFIILVMMKKIGIKMVTVHQTMSSVENERNDMGRGGAEYFSLTNWTTNVQAQDFLFVTMKCSTMT